MAVRESVVVWRNAKIGRLRFVGFKQTMELQQLESRESETESNIWLLSYTLTRIIHQIPMEYADSFPKSSATFCEIYSTFTQARRNEKISKTLEWCLVNGARYHFSLQSYGLD